MLKKIQNFLRDEEGATAVEYGLIVGLIAAGLVLVLTAIGTNLGDLFTTVSNALLAAAG